jgi:hypothetical protein
MQSKLMGNVRSLAAIVITGCLSGLTFAAERAPSEEERIAPLVTKQNCWGGIIKYVMQEHHFEVEEALCSDGGLYHLEFDEDLQLTEKRLVRKGGVGNRQP